MHPTVTPDVVLAERRLLYRQPINICRREWSYM